MTGSRIITAVVLASWAGAANAAYISNATGNGLQTVLDRVTTGAVPGDSSVDVNADQISDGADSYWRMSGSYLSFNLAFELADYDNSNTFGIYDRADPDNYVELLSGSEGPGGRAGLYIASDGSIRVEGIDPRVLRFSSRDFGFYLGRPEPLFYSDSSLNPGGADQMAAIEGTGDTLILPGKFFYEDPGYGGDLLWGDEKYIIAWEDVTYGTSDKDFNDMVLYVRPITNVPEPGTIILLGLGLAGLGAARRRKVNGSGAGRTVT